MHTVLTSKSQRKGRPSRLIDPHSFELIGSVLRRMRGGTEAEMTPAFNLSLSHRIDFLLVLEQHDAEDGDEAA